MKLKIEGCQDRAFIWYLKGYIANFIKLKAKATSFYYLDIYLQQAYKTRLPITSRWIIKLTCDSLQIKCYPASYEIVINPNKKLPGIDAKLYDICKLINYGTLDIPGTNIFTDAFNFVEANIQVLYQQYLLMG